jgi:hypothetical protein
VNVRPCGMIKNRILGKKGHYLVNIIAVERIGNGVSKLKGFGI